MNTVLRFRHNVMKITSVNSFAQIAGGFMNGCKDVYFVRLLGTNKDYIKDIKTMDQTLGASTAGQKGFYKRVGDLPKLSAYEDVTYYSEKYSQWIADGKKELTIRNVASKNELFRHTLSEALKRTEQLYRQGEEHVSDSMVKNFAVKVLFWADSLLGEEYIWNERVNSKIVVSNVTKKQEYLFWYMVSLLGNDVLLLQGEKDIELENSLKGLSDEVVIGEFTHVELPPYVKPVPQQNKPMVIPKRERKTTQVQREKSYEELAQMASSVVLIAIHDRQGKVLGTGSGIMIGKNGYILTNNHVASGGCFYSVKIEDDDNVYETDEVIKYNPVLDLAIIRIQRQLNPLPIYKGPAKLVRGQRVVAIGSPLGLFNSVSDGIISGFRNIDSVDMIQFTAPISHGSSGGAVLNMYGEVIGISTAGFDAGQNINLAMGYECINTFVQGFI